jgi:NADH-quinone oxidoreductase subunit C
MSNQEITEDLAARFGEAIFDVHEPYGFLTLTTTRDHIIDVLQYLYNHKAFRFGFLTDLAGVHFPDLTGNEMAVVYHLHSWTINVRIRIKVFVPAADPVVPTASGLFAAANWMERETFDFFGIIFRGHPNLTRVLNMEDMDYFPMRKEYPLEDQTRQDKIDSYFGR